MAKRKPRRLTAPRIRVLPLTISMLSLLLVAKLYDVYVHGNAFSALFLTGDAYAVAEPGKEEASKEEDTKEVKKEDMAEQSTADESSTSGEEPEARDATSSADNEENKVTSEEETVTAANQSAQDASDKPLADGDKLEEEEQKREFSDVELDILQSLSERREQLDKLESEIRLKESVLDATELRLDEKINQIRQLETTVRDLLKAYEKEEESKIASLVKIYENMKPKEAARIFDEMEMPILLLVVDRMAERRAAPILAKMSPLKAKQLTEELAEDRKLRTQQEAEFNNLSTQ